MTVHRAHPVMIIEYIWRFMYLLIIPLARGVAVAIEGNFAAWLAGAWLDILVLCAIIALAVAQWRLLTYSRCEDGFYVNQGIFMRSTSYVLQKNIDTLAVTRPFYLRPFRAVRLRADTKAGSFKKADIKVTLRGRDADAIFADREAFFVPKGSETREYRASGLHIAAISAMLSNSIAGVVFFGTFISHAGTLLGERLEEVVFNTLKSLAKLLALSVPPVAVTISCLLLLGWLFGFLLNFFIYKSLCVRRGGGLLTITGGLFTTREYSVAVDAINYADIRQGALTKLMGYYSIFVNAVGYGKEKDDVTAVIPVAKSGTFLRALSLLLPEFKPAKRRIKPNLGALLRFVTDALWACAGVPLAAFVLTRLLPSWRELIMWAGFMGTLPALLFLAVRILDFTSSGIGRRGDMYTLKYSKGFYLHTIIMPKCKVATVTLRQSIFQKMDNKCDVLLYSLSESRRKHHVRNLDKTMVMQVLGLQPKDIM